MTTITLVKKIKADGTPCRKCVDIVDRLERDGVAGRIDRIVIADERDPGSEGMRIARHHDVDRAPFFVVERPGESPAVYTIYMRLLREVLQRPTSDDDEIAEILRTAKLDFI